MSLESKNTQIETLSHKKIFKSKLKFQPVNTEADEYYHADLKYYENKINLIKIICVISISFFKVYMMATQYEY